MAEPPPRPTCLPHELFGDVDLTRGTDGALVGPAEPYAVEIFLTQVVGAMKRCDVVVLERDQPEVNSEATAVRQRSDHCVMWCGGISRMLLSSLPMNPSCDGTDTMSRPPAAEPAGTPG